MITSRFGVPLLVARGSGLVVEVTDGWTYEYRGSLYYSLAKVSVIHLAEATAAGLKQKGVTALALSPTGNATSRPTCATNAKPPTRQWCR